jgi:hypothetical protein
VQNTGSGDAAGAYTRFYWSADAFQSDDDALIADKTSHGLITPGTTTGMPIIATHAPDERGTYYLIACAIYGKAEVSYRRNLFVVDEDDAVSCFETSTFNQPSRFDIGH